MTDGFKFECEHCSQRIEVPDDMMGEPLDCPKCGKSITVPGTPKKPTQSTKRRERTSPPPELDTRPCPFCGEQIQPDARKCKHCGEFLGRKLQVGAEEGSGQDIEKQLPLLGGFVCMLIAIMLWVRGSPAATYVPLLFLSFVLGAVCLFQKQIAGGLILLLATVIVPLSIRNSIPGKPRVAAAPKPPDPLFSLPAQPAARQPRPPVQEQPTAPASEPEPVKPPTQERPKSYSDDPFRDVFGPTPTPTTTTPRPSETNTTAEQPAQPAEPAQPDNAPAPITVAGAKAICDQLAKEPENEALLAKLKMEIKSVNDPEQKTRLVAIYGLGCLVSGQGKEGQAVCAYLKRHFPDSPNTQYVSAEHTSGPCPACHGFGSIESDCRECKGTGKCLRCDGTGTKGLAGMNGSVRKVQCMTCHGTGKCKKCKGSGRSKTSCAACNATGTRLSPEKVRQTYLSLLGNKPDGGETDDAGANEDAGPEGE